MGETLISSLCSKLAFKEAVAVLPLRVQTIFEPSQFSTTIGASGKKGVLPGRPATSFG